MGVGVGVLALVAEPAASAAFAALICFSGCFMGCTDPSPMAGGAAGVALILLTSLLSRDWRGHECLEVAVGRSP